MSVCSCLTKAFLFLLDVNVLFFFFPTFLPSHFKKRTGFVTTVIAAVCPDSSCEREKQVKSQCSSTFPFDRKHQIVLIKCVFSDATTGKVTLPIIGLSLIVQHLELKHTRVFILTLHRDTVTSPFFFFLMLYFLSDMLSNRPTIQNLSEETKSFEKLSLPATCCSLLLTASHSRCCLPGCLPKAGALRHNALLAFKCIAVAVTSCVGRCGLRCSPLEALCVTLLSTFCGSSLFCPYSPSVSNSWSKTNVLIGREAAHESVSDRKRNQEVAVNSGRWTSDGVNRVTSHCRVWCKLIEK